MFFGKKYLAESNLQGIFNVSFCLLAVNGFYPFTTCYCAKVFINHNANFYFNTTVSNSVNKILFY